MLLLKRSRQFYPQKLQHHLQGFTSQTAICSQRYFATTSQSSGSAQQQKQQSKTSSSNLPVDESQTSDTMYLKAGEKDKPQTNLHYPRLYGHNLCFLTERVRLAMAAKQVQFQMVEMDLAEKADWHIQVNGGLIPVLEMPDGTILHESRVLMELANDLGNKYSGSKGFQLYSDDPIKAAKQRLFMEQVNNLEKEIIAFWASRGQSSSMTNHFNQIVVELEDLLASNMRHKSSNTWLFDSQNPSMADVFVIPYLERIVLLKHTPWEDAYYKLDIEDHAPIMIDYVNKFRNLDVFKPHVVNITAYGRYLDKFRKNKSQKPKLELSYIEQLP